MPPHPPSLSSPPHPPPPPLLRLPSQRKPSSSRSAIISPTTSPDDPTEQPRREILAEQRFARLFCDGISAIPTQPSQVQEQRSCPVRFQYLAERIRAVPAWDRVEFVRLLRRDGQMGSLSGANDLLAALAVAREPDVALQVFDEMPAHGCVPDAWTFSTLIVCHCSKNSLDDATRILDFMVENELCLSVATFTTLVNSFCRKHEMQKAFAF